MVETTGSTVVPRKAVDALAARGTAVSVGAPPFGSEVSLDVNAMLPGRQIVGLTLGDSETETLPPSTTSRKARRSSRCCVSESRVGRPPVLPLARLFELVREAEEQRIGAGGRSEVGADGRPSSAPPLQPSPSTGLPSFLCSKMMGAPSVVVP